MLRILRSAILCLVLVFFVASTLLRAAEAQLELKVVRTDFRSILLSWVSRRNDAANYVIERREVGQESWQEIARSVLPASARWDEGLKSGASYEFQLRALAADGTTLASSEVIVAKTLADRDSDGLSDEEETRLGTNPEKSDSDGDGIPDGWEVKHELNPLVADDGLDLDGDGQSNLSEYRAKTDPRDFFNGEHPQMQFVDGYRRGGSPGSVEEKELRVKILNGRRKPWANAPVMYQVVSTGKGLISANNGPWVESVSVRTNAEGEVAVRLKYPSGSKVQVMVDAKCGDVTRRFFGRTTEVPSPTAPENVTAERVGLKEVEVTWEDKSDDEAGFVVERSEDDETWEVLSVVPANTTSYRDTRIEIGASYTYSVTATYGGKAPRQK